MKFLIIFNVLLLLTSYTLCQKNETKKEEDRQFLIGRPQIPQLNGGVINSPLNSLLGSSFNPPGSLGASQFFPNSFGSRTGPSGLSSSNPFLAGFGLRSPGLQNPLLGGAGGLGGLSSINRPLLGINNFGNPLLSGLGSLTPGNDITGGNLPQSSQTQLLLRQLQNANQLNGLNSPFLNPNNFLQQNLLSQRELLARRQLDQMNYLKRLGLVPTQQLPSIGGDPVSGLGLSRQKTSEDELRELRILQYILGNDGLKDVLGPGGHLSGRNSSPEGLLRSRSSRNNLPRRGPLPPVTSSTRFDTKNNK